MRLAGLTLAIGFCVYAEILPTGTGVEARFAIATGSGISHPGDRVKATVIAPVMAKGRIVIPQGATIAGVVENVDRLGLGLKHLTASLQYHFDKVELPDGTDVPVEARLLEVETAKERVSANGTASGIYPMANLSSTVSYYLVPLLFVDPAFGVPMLGVKFIIARSPDPEIYFPAGTEVVIQLTTPANFPGFSGKLESVPALSAAEQDDVQRLLQQLPEQRASRGGDHPSDLINIVFIGTRDQIDRAFKAAGWSGAQPRSLLSIYRMYHSMVQRAGYSMAPMCKLTLNGFTADADYQKSLDTFSKRHHLRLWKQGENGTWLSAATEDVNYKFRRMHLTHATDPRIDNERTKVVNDLAFTGCLDAAGLVSRSNSKVGADDQATTTDGKIAVLRMNDCQEPRTMPAVAGMSQPNGRPRWAQVLAALRNDALRSNPISIGYGTTKLIARDESLQGHRESAKRPNWMRPNVLDTNSKLAQAPQPLSAGCGAPCFF